ncbi:hypothetical protein [Streptomyces sp. NBC_01669]|uniref:hypothetical protein n=1 Tax=Streptomyces sp. NBC_01669 TaxID=2975909 RepID=UPI002259C06D|nr:hypothetical protein [Streptomyces sp. NBC_01669]MCX4531933.1 hypothetical protein [Streptomyces sp. NBC_01669]
MGADPQAVVEAARPVAEHHSQTGFGFLPPGRCSAWRRINVLCRMGSSSCEREAVSHMGRLLRKRPGRQ